ncbi:hypothetical protein HYZ80_02895 [Candidatus Parcubacteria bacterium]|nr:hypothetical protein [Candidatus Parcubacteria bacterium]
MPSVQGSIGIVEGLQSLWDLMLCERLQPFLDPLPPLARRAIQLVREIIVFFL